MDAGIHPPSGATGVPRVPDPRQLLALLADDDLDAAIDAGLATLDDRALAQLPPEDALALARARDRLLAAWATRERHRARDARLARLRVEREARRQARPGVPAPAGRPALPPAAAAALARATARAGRR